jgi:peptide/nickel transport system ATP-binding protein
MLLQIRGLNTWFHTRRGIVRAVNGVDLTVDRGETVALVGESGSGKSVTAHSILRLVPPPGRIVSGEVLLDGTDLLRLGRRAMRAIRGARVAMVFQEPRTALNPVQTIGAQIVEAVRLHTSLSRRAAWARAVELLELVQIPSPVQRAHDYPHQLSGGMCQRVVIAIALACEPALLIADEPTTALDVTTQNQILALLRDLQQRLGMGILLITHDLGVVAQVADRAAVMYAGRIVESGPTGPLFDAPAHPYTAGLLGALLREAEPGSFLPEIPGSVPLLLDLPPGCAFAPRCAYASPRCRQETPALTEHTRRHACFHPLHTEARAVVA